MDSKLKYEQAKRLIRDDTFKEAFSVVKEYHKGRILEPSATDEDALAARRMVLALIEVEAQLKTWASQAEKGSAP